MAIELNKTYLLRGLKVKVLNEFTKEGIKLVNIEYLDNNEQTTILHSVFIKRAKLF